MSRVKKPAKATRQDAKPSAGRRVAGAVAGAGATAPVRVPAHAPRLPLAPPHHAVHPRSARAAPIADSSGRAQIASAPACSVPRHDTRGRATQSFRPGGSAWRRCLRFSPSRTPSPGRPRRPSFRLRPREAAKLIAASAIVRPAPVPEVATLIASGADLRPPPPGDVLVAWTERTAHVDKCVAPSSAGKPMREQARGGAEPGGVRAHAGASLPAAQTNDLVVYSDKYRQIAFPMGDVPPLYGVCTDVVVRAYRALGIDLQVLVHKARLGTGDTSIDHRRTNTLAPLLRAQGRVAAGHRFCRGLIGRATSSPITGTAGEPRSRTSPSSPT